jgi:hypothetical protein
MSASPATGTLPVVAATAPAAPLLAMRGSADAAAWVGDACLVPGAVAAADPVDDGASPAADLARVRDAIDSGRAI